MTKGSEKIAFLGCGRGLGAEVVRQWQARFPEDTLLLSSRTVSSEKHSVFQCDFSKEDEVEALLEKLYDFTPQRIFYFAGGGPHGLFMEKNWKDHMWALNVSFLTPMRVLHSYLNRMSCQQVVVVGSAIAENNEDSSATSYSAAKHGLLGLIKNLRHEVPKKDLRLFSPGYMDTDMLPPKAGPRHNGQPILSKEAAASSMIDWSQDLEGRWHYLL